ncbi:hypothetical protein CYMTET_22115 [Cymbomonas tetramitiformis]|uniref:Uncharacterized protein n=1 Tax=Cymbomonas tetramitiformis TaxID=36881 RepID=A0AAE0G0W0_9CHLO|nr:hypothetical protein CYMTET_22115 [Cymbomonas tetramitiformis]
MSETAWSLRNPNRPVDASALQEESVKIHVSSKKHLLAKKEFSVQRDNDAQVKDILTSYFIEHEDEETATLDPAVHLYRYRVTEGLLFAGIPISKSDYLRPLLERAEIKLTGAQHLGQYVPKIEALEFAALNKELQGESVFLMYDGTRRLGEAINVVGRFCSESFALVQRLLSFQTLSASPDNAALSTTLSNVATKQLDLDYEAVSGERVGFAAKREFVTAWLILVQNNNTAKTKWKALTSQAMGMMAPCTVCAAHMNWKVIV